MSRSFFDFFPTPKFLEMPAPGISISDNGIRFIEFLPSKKGMTIKRFDEVRFSSPLIVAGNITDPQNLIKELETFRTKHNLRYVRAGLPEEKAYLFTTTLSLTQKENVKTAIEFTIEENVPLSVSESVFDYTVISPREKNDSSKLRVSVAVLPEGVVAEYLEVFRAAGYEPTHFEIESQAIAKAVVPRHSTQVSIILNLSCNKVGLYICEGRAVAFTSTIPVSPFPIDASAQGPTNLSQEASKTPPACLPPSPQTLKEIDDELKKIFLYWQTQADKRNEKAQPIEKIILVGEEANRPGLLEFFSEHSHVGVELGQVWQNALSLDRYIPEIPKDESLKYAATIGLALTERST